jgi:hypothetical protein
MGTLDEAVSQGLTLLDDMSGHPSMSGYIERGSRSSPFRMGRNRTLKATIRPAAGGGRFRQISGANPRSPRPAGGQSALLIFLFGRRAAPLAGHHVAMGAVVAHLAADLHGVGQGGDARLMWNLNDESGGIGWGSPEAMGEITAVHGGLATEFANILISYIDPAGNFLEHERLQRGSLWGVGRLAHARPELAKAAAPFLADFFDNPDPYLRGTAIWAAGAVLEDAVRPLIETRLSDNSPLKLYRQMRITDVTVSELARAALAGPESTFAQQSM